MKNGDFPSFFSEIFVKFSAALQRTLLRDVLLEGGTARWGVFIPARITVVTRYETIWDNLY